MSGNESGTMLNTKVAESLTNFVDVSVNRTMSHRHPDLPVVDSFHGFA